MRTEIEAIKAAVVGAGTPPRVFYEIGYDATTGAIYAPADDSFVAEMVTLAGGEAITTGDPNSYEIPLEVLISADPEVILLGVNPFYMPTPEEVAARPGWEVMTAVSGDAIVPVEDMVITRPGPAPGRAACATWPRWHLAGPDPAAGALSESAMAAGALPRDLGSHGLAAWIRGRPLPIAVRRPSSSWA